MKKLLSGLTLKAKIFLEDIFSFISTPECPGCGQALDDNRRPICQKCESSIKDNYFGEGPLCLVCHAPDGINCDCRIAKEQKIPQMYFWSKYDETIRGLIHRFKFDGQLEAGQHLSEMANQAMKDRLDAIKADFIIPIPMKRHDIKTRGFNQTEIIGLAISKAISVPLNTDILIKIKSTKLQASLPGRERWDNLKGAFGVNNSDALKDKTVLLVDDIVTTGATCLESASALYKAGAAKVVVYALALADTKLSKK
jgi:competence protein ComFC